MPLKVVFIFSVDFLCGFVYILFIVYDVRKEFLCGLSETNGKRKKDLS